MPIVIALRKRPDLESDLHAAADGALDDTMGTRLARDIAATGALDETRGFADEQVAAAVAILEGFEATAARAALTGIAHAMIAREV
jgi:hypothetical protein